jgi:hypothetical protein
MPVFRDGGGSFIGQGTVVDGSHALLEDLHLGASRPGEGEACNPLSGAQGRTSPRMAHRRAREREHARERDGPGIGMAEETPIPVQHTMEQSAAKHREACTTGASHWGGEGRGETWAAQEFQAFCLAGSIEPMSSAPVDSPASSQGGGR